MWFRPFSSQYYGLIFPKKGKIESYDLEPALTPPPKKKE